MEVAGNSLKFFILLLAILHRFTCSKSIRAVCQYSVADGHKIYNYNLASPISKFPHGALSEDGFYKLEVNKTVLWFQLCDGLVFNHNLPRCFGCSVMASEILHGQFVYFKEQDCGGPSHCGMGCSALVANNIGGYFVCTALGQVSSIIMDTMDKKNPHTGVIVKMSSSGQKLNCSLSVSVICDLNGIQGPNSLAKTGACDYATALRHPSGCAETIHVLGKGWGWFGTFILIVLCLFGAYLLAGAVYRHFVLGIRGIEVIPNLNFWTSLPHSVQSWFSSVVRRFKTPSQGYRSSYSPVNF